MKGKAAAKLGMDSEHLLVLEGREKQELLVEPPFLKRIENRWSVKLPVTTL
jgi:hypothetical protein